MDKKSSDNKVFKLFSRKTKEHRENTEIKVNIDIFYELFTQEMSNGKSSDIILFFSFKREHA